MLFTAITLLLASRSSVHAYDYRPYYEYSDGLPLTTTEQPKLFMAFGLQHKTDICVPAFEAPIYTDMVGQDLILSLGGASGQHLHTNCTKQLALGLNLIEVIDKVKPVGIDLDIEGDGRCDHLNYLAHAMRIVKKYRPTIMFGLTVGAYEVGITTEPDHPGDCYGSAILHTFYKLQAMPDYINIMSMYLGTPDAQVNMKTYMTVIDNSLKVIKEQQGYGNWTHSKLGVTFTYTDGDGKITVPRTQELVKVLPKDLAFVSIWKYTATMPEATISRQI